MQPYHPQHPNHRHPPRRPHHRHPPHQGEQAALPNHMHAAVGRRPARDMH